MAAIDVNAGPISMPAFWSPKRPLRIGSLLGDIASYTDIVPMIQVSEAIVKRSER